MTGLFDFMVYSTLPIYKESTYEKQRTYLFRK
jgi:hypothetical protein